MSQAFFERVVRIGCRRLPNRRCNARALVSSQRGTKNLQQFEGCTGCIRRAAKFLSSRPVLHNLFCGFCTPSLRAIGAESYQLQLHLERINRARALQPRRLRLRTAWPVRELLPSSRGEFNSSMNARLGTLVVEQTSFLLVVLQNCIPPAPIKASSPRKRIYGPVVPNNCP